jgi:RHS repeat-associated protein
VVEVVKSSLVTCRFYECTNHLGNVLITISDRKKQIAQASPNQTKVRYYKAIVINANDYYPFGMTMPGRTYYRNTKRYRYGFNGTEKDPSITKGAIDFGARIYDSRVGRFLSMDKYDAAFPFLTPYQFANNTPLQAIDFQGNYPKYKLIDIAKRLSAVYVEKIQYIKAKLENTTDEKLKTQLQIDLKLHQDGYSKVILWRYQNKQSTLDYVLEIMMDHWDNTVGPLVELTPVGDLYHVITGQTFKGEKTSRILAGVYLLPLGKMGLAAKTLNKTIKAVTSGVGKELLEQIASKAERIAKALDEKHLRAAVGDILGKPVVIAGKTYNHLKEVKDALKGIGNQIMELDKIIREGKVTEGFLDAAKTMRSQLQKQKDNITGLLTRVENEVKKVP